MKNNRTTTTESLEAFLNVISAKSKEDFCREYQKATHDECGAAVWYLIYLKGKKDKK